MTCYRETLPCLTRVQALPLSLRDICGNKTVRDVFGRRRGAVAKGTVMRLGNFHLHFKIIKIVALIVAELLGG